jgi:hypothetical protein
MGTTAPLPREGPIVIPADVSRMSKRAVDVGARRSVSPVSSRAATNVAAGGGALLEDRKGGFIMSWSVERRYARVVQGMREGNCSEDRSTLSCLTGFTTVFATDRRHEKARRATRPTRWGGFGQPGGIS